MPKIMQPFVAQLTTDNVDVFGTDVNAEVPTWFTPTFLRLQIMFSDTDALHSLKVGNVQLSESSGPHATGADNVQAPDWQKPHYLIPVPKGISGSQITLDHNAVTAGQGLAIGQWEQ